MTASNDISVAVTSITSNVCSSALVFMHIVDSRQPLLNKRKMRQGVARKRAKKGTLPSVFSHNTDGALPDDHEHATRTFTCRRFLFLQSRWCIRTRNLRLFVMALFVSLFVIAAHTVDNKRRRRRRVFPRYVRYHHDDPVHQPTPLVRRLDLNMEIYPSKRTIYVSKRAQEAQEYLKNSKDYKHNLQEPLETDDCKAQYDWQTMSFPTCNLLYETDITNLHAKRYKDEQVRLIANGYYRDVWTILGSASEKYVLKTLRYQHEHVPRNYERHRKDAIAMERLTNSPHILDIYGHCGNSGVFEYANGGDVTRMLWSSKKDTKPTITQEEKLVVAMQLTSAIAEMHNVDKEGRASIAHTDITPGQFVKVNGTFRLNDFNRARFLLWNKEKDEACGYYVANNPGKVSL